jgi:hypothetical protein
LLTFFVKYFLFLVLNLFIIYNYLLLTLFPIIFFMPVGPTISLPQFLNKFNNFCAVLEAGLKQSCFILVLDVGATCNQLRLRTCVDTIAHITDVIKAVTAASSAVDEELASSSLSRQSSVETSNLTSIDNEDIVPDLAEAMAELDNARRSSENGVTPAPDGKSRLQKGSRKRGGGQVFFFPDENLRLTMESSFPDGLGMTESFYQGSADQELDVSDDSMEGFCFLDAIGTGKTCI